jgi:methionine synthase II (cobalamin-independent)
MNISKDISIEELVEKFPESVSILRKKGIVCIICGEPVWGTLYQLASDKGLSDKEIDELVEEIAKLKGKG